MTQITIKAYYNDLNETQPEIRRFQVSLLGNDLFSELETKIAQLNNQYKIGAFTLQYVDEENERITFSSNEEFRSAITNDGNGIMKIFVKPKQKQSENLTRHPGVTCDGCNSPVVGIRYKCCECRDFDLCSKCSDQGLHSEHSMIKLNKPIVQSPFGRCGGGRRFWRHCHQQQQQQQQQEHTQQVPAHVLDFLSQFKGSELADLIEQNLPKWLQTENMSQLLEKLRKDEGATINQAQLLENVGKFLREILSPFGIDCDYFVDQKPSEPTANSETTKKMMMVKNQNQHVPNRNQQRQHQHQHQHLLLRNQVQLRCQHRVLLNNCNQCFI